MRDGYASLLDARTSRFPCAVASKEKVSGSGFSVRQGDPREPKKEEQQGKVQQFSGSTFE